MIDDDGDFMVQRLKAARLHVVKAEPGELVLEMTGAAETHHYLINVHELSRLAEQLTRDAAFLNASAVQAD